MRPILLARILLTACLLLGLWSGSVRAEGPPVRFGILSYRPLDNTAARYQPLAKYLESSLGRPIELHAYSIDALNDAVSRNAVDVILTNPGHYIHLKHHYGLSAPLVTQISKENGRIIKGFGGVILARADNDAISSLADLTDKRIATPTLDSFGGYQMQAFELLSAGFSPPVAQNLLITGMPQDRSIQAVLNRQADAAFVRSGTIEALADEGKLDISAIKIIHLQNFPAFPYASSTNLYPEWPVVVMPQVDEKLARLLTVSLLSFPFGQPNAGVGFTIPADYAGVENVLRRLHAPPFNANSDVTFIDVWRKYAPLIVVFCALTFALLMTALRLVVENRRVKLVQKRFVTLFETSPEPFLILLGGRFVDCNTAAVRLLGYGGKDQIIGTRPIDLSPATQPDGEDSRIKTERLLLAAATDGLQRFEWTFTRQDGTPLVVNITLAQTTIDNRMAILCTWHDISEQKKTQEIIWRHANFDALTNLPNRRMFMDRLELELKKSRRTGRSLAVMFLDLDRFKEVNDTLGHEKGDLLLQEVAARLTLCARETDVVARLGGDEFTIIVLDLEDAANVSRVAETILEKISAPYRLDQDTAYVSASIGITFYPEDAEDAQGLLKNADQAMYESKNLGRNRFNYFKPAMQKMALNRVEIANDLRLALAERQFQVYYQPIVNLKTKEITKAEALIRWHHPTRGLISPGDFIPIAEETGQIVQIGEWVFREAAQQAARWHSVGAVSIQISVNKSPVQFREAKPGKPLWRDYLADLGLTGENITVEITEGMLLDASGHINDQLLEFRDNGIQVSLDDFGTGYSSLAYLKKFDIDYLKIDQSFVKGLSQHSSDLALCQAIIVMAHKLGMKVIAEGIETQEQLDLLTKAQCDFGQGYLFSHPVPPQEFEKLLHLPP